MIRIRATLASPTLRLLAAVVGLGVLGAGCGGGKAPEPAPAAPPAEPKLDREAMLRSAQKRIEEAKEKQRQTMREHGVAAVTLKKVTGPKDSKKVELAFEFENAGDKELVLAEGFVVFRDGDGNALRKMKVPFSEAIKPGKKATKRGKFPLDAAEDNDHAFAKMPLKQLTVEWMPTRYRFADGSEMIGE